MARRRRYYDGKISRYTDGIDRIKFKRGELPILQNIIDSFPEIQAHFAMAGKVLPHVARDRAAFLAYIKSTSETLDSRNKTLASLKSVNTVKHGLFKDITQDTWRRMLVNYHAYDQQRREKRTRNHLADKHRKERLSGLISAEKAQPLLARMIRSKVRGLLNTDTQITASLRYNIPDSELVGEGESWRGKLTFTVNMSTMKIHLS